MKKWLGLLLCLLLLCAVSAALADSNNDRESATVIRPGELITENISGQEDLDYFKFTLSSAGRVSVTFAHEFVNTDDKKWTLCFLDEDGDQYYDWNFTGNYTEDATTLRLGLDQGTYYLLVKPYYKYSTSTVSYRFTLNFEASDAWEKEWNNTVASATAIPMDTAINGSIMYGKDLDYYKITLPEAGRISITFNHGFVNKDKLWDVSVLNVNSSTFFTRTFYGKTTTDVTTCSLGLSAGDYYVCVKANYQYDFSTAAYSFKVNYLKSANWESEFNDNIGSSDQISLNQEYSGSCMYGKDHDFYKFTLPSDGTVSITFSHDYHDLGKNWDLRVLDVNSKVFFSRVYEAKTTTEKTTNRLGLPAGDYHIEIYPDYQYDYYDGDYRFTVNYTAVDTWEKEWNNNSGEADAYTLGDKRHGCHLYGDDVDFTKVVISREDLYSFKFTHGFCDTSDNRWKVTFLNEDSNEITSWTYVGNARTEVENTISLLPGTYFIKVAQNSSYYWTDAEYTWSLTGSYTPTPQRISLSKATIATIKAQTYTGKAIKPAPVVKLNGKKLVKGTDYTVSYSNNVKIGKATVTVTGIGDYTGSKSRNFIINPRKPKIVSVNAAKRKLTVRWKKDSKVTGYQLEYGTKKDFSNSTTVEISKGTTVRKVISGLKSKKTYYIRIRSYKKVGSKKYYSAWSATKSKKVR